MYLESIHAGGPILHMYYIWKAFTLWGWVVTPFPVSPPLLPLVYGLLETLKILEIAQPKLPLLVQINNSTIMEP